MNHPNSGNAENKVVGNPVCPQAKTGFIHALVGVILVHVTVLLFCPVCASSTLDIRREAWEHPFTHYGTYLYSEEEGILSLLILQFVVLLVAIFGSQLLGIIYSAIGLKKTKVGARGKGFAIAGLIISIIGIASLPLISWVCYERGKMMYIYESLF